MSNSQYETNTEISCNAVTSGTFHHPYYSASQPCNMITPSGCDNRSYMAYATDGPYKGYYNECPPGASGPKPCDLIYTESSPQVQKECWTMCCGMKGCNQQCQANCVVAKETAKTGHMMPLKPAQHKMMPLQPAQHKMMNLQPAHPMQPAHHNHNK